MTRLQTSEKYFSHWSEDTLAPSLVIGWFSWWMGMRAHVEISLYSIWVGGSVADYYANSLPYYYADSTLPFGTLSDAIFYLTLSAACLAIIVLVFRDTKTWAGKLMTTLALFVVVVSVGYSLAVKALEDYFVRGTRLEILQMETKSELQRLQGVPEWEYENHHLEWSKIALEKYLQQREISR